MIYEHEHKLIKLALRHNLELNDLGMLYTLKAKQYAQRGAIKLQTEHYNRSIEVITAYVEKKL